jgi:transglutaminase-like putative cysteine protease
MSKTLTVKHRTTYRYSTPVNFGEHRLMIRPRDSHDIRLLATSIEISPPADIHYYHDPFNNSITIARFREPGTELRLVSSFQIEHYGNAVNGYDLEPFARNYPFVYDSEEFPDLMRSIERRYPDPERKIDNWTRRFLDPSGKTDTHKLLSDINHAIRNEFHYEQRDDPGTQNPLKTLRTGNGTCRDYALFMMEAVRSLGLAARFVTGYLYDPSLDSDGDATVGGGATHAWVQIYLPGSGWVEFDPTNALVGGTNLIRVAVVRDPYQAVPVKGSYDGNPADYLGMSVEVTVSRGTKT